MKQCLNSIKLQDEYMKQYVRFMTSLFSFWLGSELLV